MKYNRTCPTLNSINKRKTKAIDGKLAAQVERSIYYYTKRDLKPKPEILITLLANTLVHLEKEQTDLKEIRQRSYQSK